MRWRRADFVRQLTAVPSSGTCAISDACLAEQQAASAILAPADNPFTDYSWCLRRTSCTSPASSSCALQQCANITARSSEGVLGQLQLALIAVDDRLRAAPAQHLGATMWAAYAAAHGYTFIPLVANPPSNASRCANPIMIQDWQSTQRVLDVLDDLQYQHLSHFLYIELDQWPVRPLMRLEGLFHAAELVQPHGKVRCAANPCLLSLSPPHLSCKLMPSCIAFG